MWESSEPGQGSSTIDTLHPPCLATDLNNQDAATAAVVAPNQGRFFKLPVEIRLEIYRLCLPTNKVFDVREKYTCRGAYKYSRTAAALLGRTHWEVYGSEPEDESGWEEDSENPSSYSMCEGVGLLGTSRLIREEVLDILYCESTFRIIVGPKFDADGFKCKFPPANRGRIRRLMIIYKQFGTFPGDTPECRMPTFIWQEIIPNLARLKIVFEQPTGDLVKHKRGCKRNIADQMKLWCAELPPLLHDLSGLLPAAAEILVDINKQKVTTGLFKKHLGRPWKRIRTRTGYRLFPTRRAVDHRAHQLFGYVTECDCVSWDARSAGES